MQREIRVKYTADTAAVEAVAVSAQKVIEATQELMENLARLPKSIKGEVFAQSVAQVPSIDHRAMTIGASDIARVAATTLAHIKSQVTTLADTQAILRVALACCDPI